jgi:hypothetical protein
VLATRSDLALNPQCAARGIKCPAQRRKGIDPATELRIASRYSIHAMARKRRPEQTQASSSHSAQRQGDESMANGTGGTFAADAKQIGMTADDIQDLIESPGRRSGDRGVFAYKFNNKDYLISYESKGADTTYIGIKPK